MDTPSQPPTDDTAAADQDPNPSNVVSFKRPAAASNTNNIHTTAADADTINNLDEMFAAFANIKDNVESAIILYETKTGTVDVMFTPQTSMQFCFKTAAMQIINNQMLTEQIG